MYDDIEGFLKKHLTTSFIGRKLYYYESVTSTMEIARRLAQERASEGAVVIADRQTAGRGRLGRIWLTPESNLAISIILYPAPGNLPKLIMIASVAVVRAIKEVTGISAQVKWPNDVLINGKKVCGILIENEWKGNMPSFSIIGIGINTNLNPVSYPEITTPVTSLLHERGRKVSRPRLIYSLLSELEKLYLQAQNNIPVYDEWQRYMDTLGKLIRVQSGDSIEQGKAEAVTENGNLVLRHADGSLSEIVAGDVTVVKE
jgi:BirA family biotin operon repressor/biotin-[acetyl-CoA-carboxylase] ligase